ncbi:hypothetical protein QZM81_18805 [Burkholderia cepacia]|uniref:hypothetical protein n=1 Tax=Burkholderia cepacia TaxID=292 RepID=UPI0026570A43|nr:hypothetical protein [Burkholderia cepacia]MDN7857854.1 hypothetical protein [Burkholderia cepacia]
MSFLFMQRGIRAMSASWRAVRCRTERAKRAASRTRVRPKRFDAMSGNGAADGVQSGMLPAKTFEEFHRLERRLSESIPRRARLLDISLQNITDVAEYRSLQFRFLMRAHDAPRFRPPCGR